jgi:hypothetical protein
MRKAALHGTGVVIVKVVANLLHAASRLGQNVMSLPARQLSYLTSVIVIDPVAAAVLLWARYRREGARVLLAPMAGSFVFGGPRCHRALLPRHINHLNEPKSEVRACADK